MGDRRLAVLGIALLAAAGAAWLAFGRGAGAPVTGPAPATTGGPERAVGEAPREAAAGLAGTAEAEREKRPEAAPAKTGRLVVRVAAGKDAPVAGAQVRVWVDDSGKPRQATSDAGGRAVFGDLAPGAVDARADAEGYAGVEQDGIEVAAGEEAGVDLLLEAGVAFDGRAVDVRDGKGVPDARIVVLASGTVQGFAKASSRAPYDRTRADGEGRFRVRGVPDGEVATVEADADGYTTARFALRVNGGVVVPTPVLVRMAPGGRVVGVVRDPEGKPVVGATVYVMREWEEGLRKNPRVQSWSTDGSSSRAARAETDAKGAYAVGGLALDETYVAVADGEGLARSTEAAGLRLHLQRLEAVADLALRPPARLVVRLVDLEGRPVTDPAALQVGEFIGGARKTAPDAANEYRFEGLNVGETSVGVTIPGFLPAAATVTLVPGVTTEHEVRLDPGAAVEGVVVDEGGKPVEGAEVTVGPAAENRNRKDTESGTWLVSSREGKSDAAGRFRIGGLEPGDVLIAADHRGAGGRSRTPAFARVAAPAREQRLVLVRLASMSLRLLLPDGTPFTGSAYVLHARHGQGRGGGSTKVEAGVLRLDELPGGEIDVEVSVAGHAVFFRTFDAPLRRHVDLGDVRLDAGLDVVGRVVDLAGNPVPGAEVGPVGAGASVSTDARGAFRLPNQPRGAVARLRVRAEGFLSKDVEAFAGRDAPEVRLARGAVVRGVVRGPDGKVAVDARLVAVELTLDGKVAEGGEREWDAAGEDGRADWRLPAGRWRIAWGLPSGEEIPLGEWTLAEGEVREVSLTLPAR